MEGFLASDLVFLTRTTTSPATYHDTKYDSCRAALEKDARNTLISALVTAV